MKYNISELIDVPELQRVMEALYQATSINHALLDLQGNVLTAAGWDKTCVEFHRAHPESCKNCETSDRYIFSHLAGQNYVGYECLNGLFDYATPVTVNGEHVATIFTGQMLHEPPDIERFRQQARRFGYDETTYLESVAQVAVVPRERMAAIMEFLARLAQLLGRNGAARLEYVARIEQERRRVACEMHDELGQLLTAQAMQVALLDLRFGDGNSELREKTRDMAALVEKTIHAVRHLATSLRPAALDHGLLAALEWLVADFNRRGSARCRLDAPGGDVDLNDASATALFRIAQEALTNVRRHAGAGEVLISLERSESLLRLAVQDDGCGFDVSSMDNGAGFGLYGMRARAREAGDTLRIDSSPGNGTRITVEMLLVAKTEPP
ncbi:MAG TPA: PocR ligand-binding domain-containing protein [Burkholderiaceae bacterium]|nr:PocR ligand-binding domain-containing protein [Burkholderiaceae bacterium]